MVVKIKISELQGAALDWAVAKCEGTLGKYIQPDIKRGTTKWEIHPTSKRYSTHWSQGGPIIERERISVWEFLCRGIAEDYTWVAETESCRTHGPTPLIAAMRCYVASKLGDEVEIPEELK